MKNLHDFPHDFLNDLYNLWQQCYDFLEIRVSFKKSVFHLKNRSSLSKMGTDDWKSVFLIRNKKYEKKIKGTI